MIQSLCRRGKKRGISTILGVLFMVGILFTSIIPLFLYVNEVNNYYDRTVADLKIADDDRGMEDLSVYAFPHNDTSVEIDLFLYNRCPQSLNVTRIWIVRADLEKTLIYDSANISSLPTQLRSSGQVTIQGLSIAPILTGNTTDDYFNVKVATARGKQYASNTNPLHKIVNGWEIGVVSFQIQALVLSDWGLDAYVLQIFGADSTTSGYYNQIESYQLHGDFYALIPVWKAGTYNITAWKYQGGTPSYKIDSSMVMLSWNHPTTFIKFDDETLT